MKWKLAEWRGGERKEENIWITATPTRTHTCMWLRVWGELNLISVCWNSWNIHGWKHQRPTIHTCYSLVRLLSLSLSASLPPTHSREHKSNILYAYLYCPCCSLLLLHGVQCGCWREIKVLLFSEKFLHFNATLSSWCAAVDCFFC